METRVRSEFFKQQIDAIEDPNSTVGQLRSALAAIREPIDAGDWSSEAATARVRVALARKMHEDGHSALECLQVLEDVATRAAHEARDIILRKAVGEQMCGLVHDLGCFRARPWTCGFVLPDETPEPAWEKNLRDDLKLAKRLSAKLKGLLLQGAGECEYFPCLIRAKEGEIDQALPDALGVEVSAEMTSDWVHTNKYPFHYFWDAEDVEEQLAEDEDYAQKSSDIWLRLAPSKKNLRCCTSSTSARNNRC